MTNNNPTLHIDKTQTVSFRKDMILVLLVLVFSGNPAPARILPVEPQIVTLALFLGFMLLKKTKRFFTPAFNRIASIYLLIILVQCIELSFYPFVTISGFFVRLFIGYAMCRVVNNFSITFVRVMVGLALLSLMIYVPYIILSVAGINFEATITYLAKTLDTIGGGRRPLFLHTFLGCFSFRNAGMFWEPGAFQGYLILALIFLTVIKHDIPRKDYVKYLLILCAAVLSTLSTTGYIALILIPILHYEWSAKNQKQIIFRILIGVYLFIPLLVVGGLYAYRTLPFLGTKIESQMHTLDQRQGRWYRGRMGSLNFDWEYIQRRPFTGWGLNPKTRYALHPWMKSSEGMGNGFSDFTAKVGMIGFVTWFFSVYIGFRSLSGSNKLAPILICGILLLELQGECFLGYPLFLGLAFIDQASVHRTSHLPVFAQA